MTDISVDSKKSELMTRFESVFSEFENVQMNPTPFRGVTTIPNKWVKSEWETGLSDILFGVVGFSHFFGALAFRCDIKWTFSIPTAGAGVGNGKFYIYLNPFFLFEYLQKHQYRTFVIVHEIFHIFYEHNLRGEAAGYDAELFNMAADYYNHCAMNQMLINSPRCRNNLELLPKSVFPICFDTKYDGMTEDEIYKTLVKEAKERQGESGGDDKSTDSGSSNQSEGQGGSSQQGDEKEDERGQRGQGQQGQPLNRPSYDYSKIDGEAFDSVPMSSDVDDASINRTKMEISSAIRAAAVQAQKANSIGDAEADIIRRFLELSEPKVDWREQCMEFFENTRDQLLTYSHYNRRSTHEILFPSKAGEFIRVFWGVDTSGSMGADDLTMAASELQGFLDQIDGWEVVVATADTKAYEIATLRSEEEDSLHTVEVDFKGGGGTRMSALVALAQEERDDEEEYDFMVIITDGHLMPGDITDVYEEEIPLLVLVTDWGQIPEWLEASDNIKVVQMGS